MSRERKEPDGMPYVIRSLASCGRRRNRINRRFKPDRLLALLENDPMPRKSAFTGRKLAFKDTQGRKYYRDTTPEAGEAGKGFVSSWYWMVLPVRKSVEDEKVRWPADGAVSIQSDAGFVHATISQTHRPPATRESIARVFLVFD